MERLAARVERFIRTHDGEFESLALEVFRHQVAGNAAYRAYVEGLGIRPGLVQRWSDIPAVPIRAFKSAELTTVPPLRAAAVFESSRTTGQTPSRHYIKDPGLYELSVAQSFQSWVLPDHARLPFLILTPPPGEAPRSSLSWMMDTVVRRCGALSGDYFILRGRLDEMRLAYVINRFIKEAQPAALLGTTLSFLAFFDYCLKQNLKWKLPAGSRLMDTGGMKGIRRSTTRSEFVAQVGEFLGIPDEQCFNEYGMCEMSSQFYGRGSSTEVCGPAWVRTRIMEGGLLCHYDLANLDSVMAIQTEDIGKPPSPHPLPRRGEGVKVVLSPFWGEGIDATASKGEGRLFTLLGRAPGSEMKGCSLSTETV